VGGLLLGGFPLGRVLINDTPVKEVVELVLFITHDWRVAGTGDSRKQISSPWGGELE